MKTVTAETALPTPLNEAHRRRFREYQLLMMSTLIGFYAFSYTCRLGLSVVKKPLIDQGIYSATQLGWIGAAFLWAYAIGKLVNGFLSDHVRIRWFMPMGLLISALMNGLMGATTFLGLAIGAWAINGLVQGISAPASVVLITRWFSSKQRGSVYGIWSASHSMGEGLTFIGSAALVGWMGWRAAFWGPAMACMIVAIVSMILLRDRPQEVGLSPIETPKASTQKTTVLGAQWNILTMSSLWVLGLASAMMYVGRYAVNNWGMLYLQEHHGYEPMTAAGILSINTWAGILGSATYGVLSDWLFSSRRPPLTLLFGIVEIAGLILFYFAPPGCTWMLQLGMVLYGFTLSGLLAVLGGLFAVDLGPKQAAGAIMGFIGIFSYLGAGAQDLLSGLLIEEGTTVVAGVKTYDFTLPIYFWVGSAVLSMILAATQWDAQPIEK